MKTKAERRRRIWRVLVFLCAAVFLVSGVQVIRTLWTAKREDDTFRQLEKYTQAEAPVPARDGASPADMQEEAAERESQKRHDNYLQLQALNPDFAGWLYIAGTKVDYPVMCTPDDEQYYIHRDFYGKPSVSGTPFMGAGCSTESQSILIYGHNMKNGSMFGTLDSYENVSYWREHPVICFNTVDEDREYEVAAAFRTRIYAEDEPGFRYYNYAGDLSDEDFEAFAGSISAAAAYQTGVELKAGDELLILSTCAYHTTDGRFVVVARRTK